MTSRILNGIERGNRVYIDVRDLIELLRATGETKRADELTEWETQWRRVYGYRK